MSNSDTVLGKINSKKCYINEGKYGHYLTHESKNYKIPEWFPAEKWISTLLKGLLNIKRKCLSNGVNQNLLQKQQLNPF